MLKGYEQPGLVRESISHYFKSRFSLNKIDFKKVMGFSLPPVGPLIMQNLSLKLY